MIVFAVGTFAVLINYKTSGKRTDLAKLMLNENVEALTAGESGGNYNICYSESKVVKGYTYYDCGNCQKVYDEKGKGNYSKCFY